jgi:hypothetical protein
VFEHVEVVSNRRLYLDATPIVSHSLGRVLVMINANAGI